MGSCLSNDTTSAAVKKVPKQETDANPTLGEQKKLDESAVNQSNPHQDSDYYEEVAVESQAEVDFSPQNSESNLQHNKS